MRKNALRNIFILILGIGIGWFSTTIHHDQNVGEYSENMSVPDSVFSPPEKELKGYCDKLDKLQEAGVIAYKATLGYLYISEDTWNNYDQDAKTAMLTSLWYCALYYNDNEDTGVDIYNGDGSNKLAGKKIGKKAVYY